MDLGTKMNSQYITARSGLVGRVAFSLLLGVAIVFSSLVCLNKMDIINVKLPSHFGIYIKPSVDKTAKTGEPSNEAIVGFDVNEVSIGNGISFCMAEVLYRQADGSVKIFLINPSEAGVNLLAEIKNADTGKTLFRSGFIDAGQYIERMNPKGKWENAETAIKIYVYAVDPARNISCGTFEFETVLQPW
jgi:hypothetical protein